MKTRRFFLLMAGLAVAATQAMAQGYYDDDIYYNPAKDEQAKAEKAAQKAAKEAQKRYEAEARLAGQYDAADLFASQANGTRTISVDDYNRRGIFAVDSVLAADSTRSDFEYTRRIEQFYNPGIADLVNADEDVANIYYVEPQTVNLYVNTPSSYWGYDYFASPYYSPYYSWNFGWGAPSWSWNWGWNSWYGPSWSWGWGPSWAWGPSWGWGPAWGPSWGWGGYYPPAYHRPAFIDRRHPGAGHGGNFGSTNPSRPGGHVASGGSFNGTNGGRRPGAVSTGTRPSAVGQGGNYNTGSLRGGLHSRPASTQVSSGRRPSTTTYNQATPSTSRPSVNSNSTNRTNGGRQTYNNNSTTTNRTPSYSSPSRPSSGSFGGGGSRSSAGGRGRH